MAILAELDLEPEAAERRGAARRQLRLVAEGSTPSSASARVIVRDLSVGGLLIESAQELAVGELLAVSLPEAGPVDAIVMWSSGRYAGCKFTRPLPNAAVSAAQLMSSPIEGDAEVIAIALAELRALGTRIQHITEAVDRATARLKNNQDK